MSFLSEKYNYIKKIIQEVLGVQTTVSEISESMLETVLERIKLEFNRNKNIKSNQPIVTTIQFRNEENSFPINVINIRVIIHNSINQKISGSFLNNRTNQIPQEENFVYEVNIDIDINGYELFTEEELKKYILSVLNHELHHAYDHVVRINKKSTTKILNRVRKDMFILMPQIMKTGHFKDFMDVFYLNLPEERNARIQQLYSELSHLKNKNVNDIVIELGKLTAFKDFIKLADYNSESLLSNTTQEEQKEFVDRFNQLLTNNKDRFNLESEDINYPKTPERFFKFWEQQFHKNAEQSRRKSLKIIANIKNIIKENKQIEEYNSIEEVLNLLDEDGIESIFGNKHFLY